jgi:probable F420-dependent oxidoreductase
MVDICLGLWGSQELVGGDFASVIDLVRMADEKGIDQVDSPDHVLMAKPERYIYGKFPVPVDYPWYEPVAALAAFAAVTKRIRLTNGVMVAPLRAAPLLAKQFTTIDVLSRGRLDIGIGAGWMPEEFAACNVSWEKRFDYLFEMVQAMRALWGGAPATFRGARIDFERVWQLPFPVQNRIPVHFGLGVPSERNFARIAEVGDGWYPMEEEAEPLADQIRQLKAAFAARGRDPETAKVRVMLRPFYDAEGKGDLDKNLKKVPALARAGVTTMCFPARAYCRGLDDFEPFLDRILAVKD